MNLKIVILIINSFSLCLSIFSLIWSASVCKKQKKAMEDLDRIVGKRRKKF